MSHTPYPRTRQLRDASTSDVTLDMLMSPSRHNRDSYGSLVTADSFEGSIEDIRRDWPSHLTQEADYSAELAAKREAVQRLQVEQRETLIRRALVTLAVMAAGLATVLF